MATSTDDMEKEMNDTITRTETGAIVASGPAAVEVYRAVTIASALRLYAKTGLQPNRAYTPKAMMNAATQITGKKFKARAYVEAADALKAWADEQNGTTINKK